MSVDRRRGSTSSVTYGAQASGRAVFVVRTREVSSVQPLSPPHPPDAAGRVALPAGPDSPPETLSPPTAPPPTAGGRLHGRASVQWTAAAAFLAIIVSASVAVMPARPARTTNRSVSRATPAPANVNLSGHGPATTRAFTAGGGLAVLSATYEGSSPFHAEVDTPNGRTIGPQVAGDGPYRGSVAIFLERRSYVVKVAADGPWSIVITQTAGQA